MAKRALRHLFVACVIAAAFLALAAWRAGVWFDDTALTVWVFDVGQGDAIFIDAPDAQVLIDGGRGDVVLEKLAAVLPPWDRSLDLVIASHPHADHIEGLNAVLEVYDVGEVVDSATPYDVATAVAFDERNGDQTVASSGVSWDLGNGARLDVVWPDASRTGVPHENVHDANVVLLLTYGATTVLLTGDAEQEYEEAFAAGLPHVDVLKVGHHGSDTSTSPALLNMASPNVAIVSVGALNTYGHPSSLVVDRLQRAGATVLRTDEDGDIRVWSNGGEPEVTRIPL